MWRLRVAAACALRSQLEAGAQQARGRAAYLHVASVECCLGAENQAHPYEGSALTAHCAAIPQLLPQPTPRRSRAGALQRLLDINRLVWCDDYVSTAAFKISSNITAGVRKHGLRVLPPGSVPGVKGDPWGDAVYAYEVDGRGNAEADFDQPAVMSLLALPALGWEGYDRRVRLWVARGARGRGRRLADLRWGQREGERASVRACVCMRPRPPSVAASMSLPSEPLRLPPPQAYQLTRERLLRTYYSDNSNHNILWVLANSGPSEGVPAATARLPLAAAALTAQSAADRAELLSALHKQEAGAQAMEDAARRKERAGGFRAPHRWVARAWPRAC